MGGSGSPDLNAYELTFSPSSPTVSSPVTVAWKVKNQGSTDATPRFYTKLYVDGAVKQTWHTEGLKVNYYTTASKDIGTLSAGTHTLKIMTDTTGAITESNESNNQISKTVTVGGTGKSDLNAYELTYTPTSPTVHNDVTVTWKVRNQGSGDANGRFYTKLYVDGALRQTWHTDGLKANYYTHAAKNIGKLSTGQHTLKVETDTTGAIPESNESNNVKSAGLVVGGSGKPDLHAYELTCNPVAPGPSTQVTAAWKVKNQGTVDVTHRFYTKLYLDGALKQTWYTDKLQAGYYTHGSKSLGALGAGTHTLKIVTDATKVVLESKESNNERQLVPGAPSLKPDLYAYHLAYTPSAPQANGAITVTWRVKNQGTQDIANRFYTRLFVDNKTVETWHTEGLKANYYAHASKDIGTLTAGSHKLAIQTDITSAVPESNENNNQKTVTVTVGQGGPTVPDIRVTPALVELRADAGSPQPQRTALADRTVAPSRFATEVQADLLTVTCTFPLDSVTLSQSGEHTLVSLGDGELPEDRPGDPWLPVQYVNVLIPAGTRVTNIAAKADEKLIAKDVTVYPVQPPVPLSLPAPATRRAANRASYAVDGRVPESFAVLMGHNALREHTMASIRLNPVRYNPARRELYLATTIRLILRYERTVQPLALAPLTANAMFDDMVREMVVNPQTVGTKGFKAPPPPRTTLSADPVDYLIITSSNLAGAFRALAEYRQQSSGLRTAVVTVESIRRDYGSGNDDAQKRIRLCIGNYFRNRGTRYVVLGGDDTVVPDRDCFVTVNSSSGLVTERDMPTDLYYADVTGSWDADGDGVYGEADYSGSRDEGDLTPEVLLGRIPVRSAAQLNNYLAKLRRFESLSPGSDIFGKMMMCGHTLWNIHSGNDRPSDSIPDGLSGFRQHSPVSDAEIWERRMYRDGIRPHWTPRTLGMFFNTLTSWDRSVAGDYLLDSTRLSTRLNGGWYHLFFGTHGGPDVWSLESGGFRSSHALNLTGLVPIVYTMACLTGKFDSHTGKYGAPDPCLSEAFVRGANGAVAYFGCSRYGWGTPRSPRGGESIDYAYEFYRQLLDRKVKVLGSAFSQHKTARIGSAGVNGTGRWVMFGMNYQGDPAIGTARSGGGGTQSFAVHNDGKAPLIVSSVTETASWLSLDTGGIREIAPGGKHDIALKVNWSAVPAGGATTEVLIASNDPDEGTVKVKVVAKGANRGPLVSSREPSSDLNFVKPDQSVALSVAASDPEGDALTYAWYLNDSPAPATGASLRFSAAAKDRGPNMVRVEITDSHGQTTTTQWQMLVGEGDPDLVGYWPMDEEKGRDWSGWGHDLNVKGSVDFTWDGVHGKALKLSVSEDGGSDR